MKNLLLLCFFCSHLSWGQDFTFVFLNKKLDRDSLSKEEAQKIQDGHMANIGRLAKEGKLIAAGPFEGGGGIFIFRSKSTDEVRGWLDTDPGVRAKRWNIEILPFSTRTGSVCAVSEPYEMVLYDFVRYRVDHSKKASMVKEAIKAHDSHLASRPPETPIIAEGIFGNDQGGIIVSRVAFTESWFSNDHGVRSGIITADQKKLYIAKGAFCEK